MSVNNLMDKIFQIGLVIAIPAVSYIYAQGVSESNTKSLNHAITELNMVVKELSNTTAMLSNNAAVLSAQAQRNERRLDVLEDKVEKARIDLASAHK